MSVTICCAAIRDALSLYGLPDSSFRASSEGVSSEEGFSSESEETLLEDEEKSEPVFSEEANAVLSGVGVMVIAGDSAGARVGVSLVFCSK